ncbi:MAG: hypothetical protein KME20_09000 [Kaiparowitsia implicata GSE-PSE-MK54-09C]|jgi:hypothetical protein|nr:hypothetical protein [Kaiparowitsia implicata GSE-PSE-MK54-09C]
MKITLDQGTRTLSVIVPEDQISDELLGILSPLTTRTAEGCLAWSIGFSDAFRAPSTSSGSTGATEDALLGPVGAIVGPIASQGIASSGRAEGKIRGTLILTLNNSAIGEESASTTPGTLRATFRASDFLPTTKRLQDEFASELNATESQQISLGSNSV